MDAPFRLAALATHPPSGGGQENDGCPLPSRCARHPPPQVGVGKKKMDAPFRLAALATHPLSGGGQEKHGGEGRLAQNLASPCLQGEGDRVSTSNLASPPCSRWQGTTFPKPCLPPLAGGGGPRSQNLASPRSRWQGNWIRRESIDD